MAKIKYNKFAQTVLYLLHHCTSEPPGKRALLKMLWYADYWHYKENLRLLTGGEYVALRDGPTLNNYEALFTKLENDGIVKRRMVKVLHQRSLKEEFQPKMEPDLAQFTDSERTVLAEVVRRCGNVAGNALSERTHREGPWQLVWDERRIGQPVRPIVFRWLENLPTERDIVHARKTLSRPGVLGEISALNRKPAAASAAA